MKQTQKQCLTKKNEIELWLDSHSIKEYMIYPHPEYEMVVEVFGDCDLSYKNLTTIPVKLYYVRESLNVANNFLTNLDFSPLIIEENFYCHNNRLTSLRGGPEVVKGCYICSENNIQNLLYLPPDVRGTFLCSGNPKLQSYAGKEFKELKELQKIQLEQEYLVTTVPQANEIFLKTYKI